MLTSKNKLNCVLRSAVDGDATRICEVLVRSIREICAQDYANDQEVINNWCSNKTPENVTRWIQNSDNFFQVLDSPPTGIVGVAMYKRDGATIDLCYLVPEALGQGNGARLLAAVEAEARRLGHREITLGSTITARNFYARHGYEQYGESMYWGKVRGYPMRKRLVE